MPAVSNSRNVPGTEQLSTYGTTLMPMSIRPRYRGSIPLTTKASPSLTRSSSYQ